MQTLPSDTLALYDFKNALIGVIRFAPRDDFPNKGDCIFDMEIPAADAGDEVRWLYKQRFKAGGEHKFKIDQQGAITVTQADFRITLAPDAEEGGYRVRSPAPQVLGIFEMDA
ncbi:MAG: hypothetical protein ACJAZO_000982 [Myxococcota bacterium]|jgi:hypothetical protein